jgi:hypothetical protein
MFVQLMRTKDEGTASFTFILRKTLASQSRCQDERLGVQRYYSYTPISMQVAGPTTMTQRDTTVPRQRECSCPKLLYIVGEAASL